MISSVIYIRKLHLIYCNVVIHQEDVKIYPGDGIDRNHLIYSNVFA